MATYNTIPKDAYGFIYKITNLKTQQYYIGKKNYFFKRREKKTIVFVESDWKDYYGSSDLLKKDIAKLGKDTFKREIIEVCYSKAELSYKEVVHLFKNNVLEDEKCYNQNILGKFYKGTYPKELCSLFKNKVKIKHKDKIKYVAKTKAKLYV